MRQLWLSRPGDGSERAWLIFSLASAFLVCLTWGGLDFTRARAQEPKADAAAKDAAPAKEAPAEAEAPAKSAATKITVGSTRNANTKPAGPSAKRFGPTIALTRPTISPRSAGLVA